MDVGTISTAQSNAMMNAYQAGSAKKTADVTQTANAAASQDAEKDTAGEAYSLNISDAAKQASESEQSAKSEKAKGLSADEIQALQQDVEQKSLQFMIDLMSANNEKLQDYLDNGVGKLNFGGVEIDTSRFAMPEVATTPEEAEAAISEGGDWSVSAVSDRIFGLATALAGGDPEKLEQMRSAVEKGFEQAGATFKDYFGAKDVPQITKDTHAEIMKRFDDRAAELKGVATTAEG